MLVVNAVAAVYCLYVFFAWADQDKPLLKTASMVGTIVNATIVAKIYMSI